MKLTPAEISAIICLASGHILRLAFEMQEALIAKSAIKLGVDDGRLYYGIHEWALREAGCMPEQPQPDPPAWPDWGSQPFWSSGASEANFTNQSSASAGPTMADLLAAMQRFRHA